MALEVPFSGSPFPPPSICPWVSSHLLRLLPHHSDPRWQLLSLLSEMAGEQTENKCVDRPTEAMGSGQQQKRGTDREGPIHSLPHALSVAERNSTCIQTSANLLEI